MASTSRPWLLPVGIFVALGAALVVMSRGRSSVEAGATVPPSASAAESAEPDDAPPPASAWSPPARALRHAATPGDPLAGFHGALDKLKVAKAPAKVRVLFFGDSHTQGEYLPNAVREALQSRFGDGGPGFLYAGDNGHRNEAASLAVDGLFEHAPKLPSSSLPQDDGIFGLGGIRFAPANGGMAHVTITPRVPGRMRADVCARSPGGKGRLHLSSSAKEDPKLGPRPSHTIVEVPPPGALTLDVSGDAALCGVILERAEEPGVVVDSLGISGARFATPLAWDEPSFTAEIARRAPDLVVLEYGTNDSAGGAQHAQDYARSASELIALVRRAAPKTDCIVVGPTEIEAHPEAVAPVSQAIESAAEKNGCAFWDAYHVMGGPGSMRAWRTADVQLAGNDGIHLTAGGYTKLGTLLALDLLSSGGEEGEAEHPR